MSGVSFDVMEVVVDGGRGWAYIAGPFDGGQAEVD